jgi:hypothetical protein
MLPTKFAQQLTVLTLKNQIQPVVPLCPYRLRTLRVVSRGRV